MDEKNDVFARLLTLFMRRIRASAAGVAAEIGISRESVNNWRNGISLPSSKNRDRLLACARYLRLTEAETNQLFTAAGFAVEYPLQQEVQSVGPFAGFITQLFERLNQLHPFPIIMLLSQAHWGQPPFRKELLSKARQLYGEQAVLHIQPPFSTSTDSTDFFAALGRQCGFESVHCDYEFEAALEQRLRSGERLFCLVSRFEQGTAALRETLAGILRSLSEMHSGKLHLLLCGGEALADLKYRSGDLSLLNIAQVSHWPELSLADLKQLASHAELADSDEQTLSRLLQLCGGHPALVEEALGWLQQQPQSSLLELSQQLQHSERLWQAFMPMLSEPNSRARLEQLLDKQDLGMARPYLPDEGLRRLFWNNLINAHDGRLQWRCEVVREAGKQVLAAC